ncbi:MAG TPA: glutamyl-tRNA reductase [Bacteroidetes bacterium]|nr:glutamyl-tRNA reductase [Bacteroidota bacterium]
MNLILIGINHRTAPLEIRERLWLSDNELPAALAQLKEKFFTECFIVSTCNRTELYGIVNGSKASGSRQAVADAATEMLLESRSAHDFIRKEHLYKLFDFHAATHLFKVASGIDSMVVGDIQILGQVKNHYSLAVDQNATGVHLNRLLQTALHVGKRARTETGITQGAVSASYAAVELATKIFTNLSDKKILLIGAGETGELTAKNLIDRGISSLFITNRTQARAEELVNKLDGTVVPFDQFESVLLEMDVVISSVTATGHILGIEPIRRSLKARSNTPMLLIDLGVPRNIDPIVNTLENVFLYDLDSLSKIVSRNLDRRRGEVAAINAIILEELTGLRHWFESLQVGPTISDLRDLFERVRSDEVKKHINRFATQDRELLELVTTRIINKLLHLPSTNLKNGNGESTEEQHHRVSIVRGLFGLRTHQKINPLSEDSKEE